METYLSETHHITGSNSHFFHDEVSNIRSELNLHRTQGPLINLFAIHNSNLSTFHEVIQEVVKKIITTSPVRNCNLHPLVNLSISDGEFPQTCMQSLISPVLKKPSLDPEALSNYQPISNLSFINRLFEMFGFFGTVLKWFRSYLTGRKSRINIFKVRSEPQEYQKGVPQALSWAL